MTRNLLLLIVAIVIFLLGLGYVLLADAIEQDVLEALLFGGLAALAASFVPGPR